MESNEQSRRDFVKKIAYVTPVVLTLRATPSSAQPGSGRDARPLDNLKREPAVLARESRS